MFLLTKALLMKEDLSKFHDQFTEFMQEHKLYGITQIILLKEGRIEYLTKYNYTDYLLMNTI